MNDSFNQSTVTKPSKKGIVIGIILCLVAVGGIVFGSYRVYLQSHRYELWDSFTKSIFNEYSTYYSSDDKEKVGNYVEQEKTKI